MSFGGIVDGIIANLAVYVAKRFANFARKRNLKTTVQHVRIAAMEPVMEALHSDVSMNILKLKNKFNAWEDDRESASHYASEVCNACELVMSDILEIDDRYLTCTIKVLESDADGNEVVGTWVRSSIPADRRRRIEDEDELYTVSENSTWAALRGCSDGTNDWQRPYYCFSCNDLTSHANYRNRRTGWDTYYRSAVVFPIHYREDYSRMNKLTSIGFLAFDSYETGAFGKIPDIFEYQKYDDGWYRYHKDIEGNVVFNVGSFLSAFLISAIENAYKEYAYKQGEE